MMMMMILATCCSKPVLSAGSMPAKNRFVDEIFPIRRRGLSAVVAAGEERVVGIAAAVDSGVGDVERAFGSRSWDFGCLTSSMRTWPRFLKDSRVVRLI